MNVRNKLKLGVGVAALAALAACGGGNDGPVPLQLVVDFNSGVGGWSGAAADYTAETAPSNTLFEQRAIPSPLAGKGYYVGGTNRSDDAFLYVKKQFTGFRPSTRYKLSFQLKAASDTPSGCMGVGGAPGEAVWVVVGASATEPKTVLKDGEYRVDLDRGNQAGSGVYGKVLGTLANKVPDCGARVYQSLTYTGTAAQAITIETDAAGAAWIFLGIDSGFEAESHILFQSFVMNADPV